MRKFLTWNIGKDEESNTERAVAYRPNETLYAIAIVNHFGVEYVVVFAEKSGFFYKNSLEEVIDFIEKEYEKDMVEA